MSLSVKKRVSDNDQAEVRQTNKGWPPNRNYRNSWLTCCLINSQTLLVFDLIQMITLFFFLFMFRYKSLCPGTWPNWDGKLSDGVSTLVKHLGYKPEEYKMGRSAALSDEDVKTNLSYLAAVTDPVE